MVMMLLARSLSAQPRTAVCLAGAPRTLTREHVHRSIAEQLLLPLRANGSVADVFVVLSLRDAEPKDQQDNRFARVDATQSDVRAALAALAPRAVEIRESSAPPPANPSCAFRGFMGEGADNLARSLAQPAKWETCWRMLRLAEADDGARYDWVVRARPDAWWFGAHPALDALDARRATAHSMHSDWHFALPRALAEDVMVGMLRRYRECNATLPKREAWKIRKHSSLEAWLLENMHDAAAAPAARVDFPMVVVRKSAREETAERYCRGRHAISPAACLSGAYPTGARA